MVKLRVSPLKARQLKEEQLDLYLERLGLMQVKTQPAQIIIQIILELQVVFLCLELVQIYKLIHLWVHCYHSKTIS